MSATMAGSRLAQRWRTAGVPLALLAAVAAAYANAVPAAFQFDDYNVIVDNPAVHGFAAWWASMPGIRPLLKLSYAANWVLGPGPLGFHLFNLVCHAANALMVWLLLRRWLPALAPGLEMSAPAAFTAALLFALHPAQTEAVTYVAGRSVSLMSVFYLAALLLHRPQASPLRNALAALAFALALTTRETAFTLPFAIALLQLAQTPAGTPRRLRHALRGTGALWGVLAAASVAALALPSYQRLLGASLDARTLRENLLTQIDGMWYLLTRPLLALHANIDPDLAVRTALAPDLAWKGLALAALALAGALQLRRRPWLGLGILWCFLHLLPTNSILPRLDVANDRHLYLATIGPAMIAGVLLWSGTSRRTASVAVVALGLALAVATIARNHAYGTEVALWTATARASPDKPRVWNNLGYAHRLAADHDAARAAYRRALELDPAHPKARHNLEALQRR